MDGKPEGIGGRITLVIGHCAGTIDVVALPVWIGIAMIGRIGLDSQRSGGLATLFLISVVASGLFFARRVPPNRSCLGESDSAWPA